MPPSAREAHFALRAFNVEIAGIKDSSRLVAGRAAARGSVEGGGGLSRFNDSNHNGGGNSSSSSMATRLRMQWWRDAISGIYEGHNATADDDDDDYLASSARRNPTIRSLANAVRTHGLTHRFLGRIVEAREADLDVSQYRRVRDVAQYGEDTMSNVLYLTLECLGVSIIICGGKNISPPSPLPRERRKAPRVCALHTFPPLSLSVLVPPHTNHRIITLAGSRRENGYGRFGRGRRSWDTHGAPVHGLPRHAGRMFHPVGFGE